MIDSTRTPDGSKELNEKAEKLLNSFDRTFLWNVYDSFWYAFTSNLEQISLHSTSIIIIKT